MTSRPMLLGIAAGMLAALIWGGGAVVSRYLVLNRLDPIDLTFLRYVGCLPIAALLALQAPARAHLALDWWQTALLLAEGTTEGGQFNTIHCCRLASWP